MQAALSQGVGYTISDGLFKDTAGAAAWIIEGSSSHICLIGQWHTPGPPEAHRSFRSKLAGLVGVLYMITFWPPTMIKLHFHLACNGLSVIMRLRASQPIEPTIPHFDLLMVACSLLTTSQYKVDLVFVHGHQDNGSPTALTHDAWLNIKANLLAKAKAAIPFTGPSAFKLPGNSWGCYVEQQYVATQLPMALKKLINGQVALSYWES